MFALSGPTKYPLSTRDRRGGSIKAQKKGHRARGELSVQLRRAYCVGPFSRQVLVNENHTMAEFSQILYHEAEDGSGFPLPAGLSIEIQAFKGRRFVESDDKVKKHFDGGETVYAKVFDQDGNQWVLDSGAQGFYWELK